MTRTREIISVALGMLSVARREAHSRGELHLVHTTGEVLNAVDALDGEVQRLRADVDRLRAVAIAADRHLAEGTPITRSRLSQALEYAGEGNPA